jgi:hypothetical protein
MVEAKLCPDSLGKRIGRRTRVPRPAPRRGSPAIFHVHNRQRRGLADTERTAEIPADEWQERVASNVSVETTAVDANISLQVMVSMCGAHGRVTARMKSCVSD